MANDHPPHHDDCEGIPDNDELVRRVIRVWVVPDEKNPTGYRLSTQAFEDHRQTGTPCSVAVRRFARSLDESMNLFPEHSFALLGAGFVRQHEQGICFWEDVNEPGHAYLHGPKSKTIKNALATQAAYWGGPHRWG